MLFDIKRCPVSWQNDSWWEIEENMVDVKSFISKVSELRLIVILAKCGRAMSWNKIMTKFYFVQKSKRIISFCCILQPISITTVHIRMQIHKRKQEKTQHKCMYWAGSVVSDTNVFLSFWTSVRLTRGERHNSYYADHTIWPPQMHCTSHDA